MRFLETCDGSRPFIVSAWKERTEESTLHSHALLPYRFRFLMENSRHNNDPRWHKQYCVCVCVLPLLLPLWAPRAAVWWGTNERSERRFKKNNPSIHQETRRWMWQRQTEEKYLSFHLLQTRTP